MPLKRVILSPERPCSMPAITGTPPATAAPCISWTLCFAASRDRPTPRYAISCLLAVTADLPAAKHLRSQPSAGTRPPINSTTISARELRMSSRFSAHTTEPGARRGASEVRLRSTLRLKICVSSTPGNFDSTRTRATELPTVPKPSSAIFIGAPLERGVAFFAVDADFGREVLRLIAMSVFDLIGTSPPRVETLDRVVAQQALGRNSPLVERTFYLFIKERIVEAGGGGIGGGIAVKDGVAARPVERGQAHWARLATRVDHASLG